MKGRTLLALALLGAGACSMERGEPSEDVPPGEVSQRIDQSDMQDLTEVSDEPGPGPSEYQTPSPAPVTPIPNPPGQLTVTGSLMPVNNHPITGNMTLAEVPGGTLATVQVTRARANAAYRVAIHQGSCQRQGAQLAALGPLRVGGQGVAAITDTLAVPAARVMDGAHVLVVRAENAPPSLPPVACAAIPVNRPDGG
jgi:hypothetical protein